MFEVDVKNMTEKGRRGPARVWGSDSLTKILSLTQILSLSLIQILSLSFTQILSLSLTQILSLS